MKRTLCIICKQPIKAVEGFGFKKEGMFHRKCFIDKLPKGWIDRAVEENHYLEYGDKNEK